MSRNARTCFVARKTWDCGCGWVSFWRDEGDEVEGNSDDDGGKGGCEAAMAQKGHRPGGGGGGSEGMVFRFGYLTALKGFLLASECRDTMNSI